MNTEIKLDILKNQSNINKMNLYIQALEIIIYQNNYNLYQEKFFIKRQREFNVELLDQEKPFFLFD